MFEWTCLIHPVSVSTTSHISLETINAPISKVTIFMELYVLPHHVIQINFWVTNLHKKRRNWTHHETYNCLLFGLFWQQSYKCY
jgi:uncharacterized protein YhhL (DUF1145 family)